jgi:hypothetical protein
MFAYAQAELLCLGHSFEHLLLLLSTALRLTCTTARRRGLEEVHLMW